MTALDYIVNGGSIAVLLLTAIQISPIKINPWSALAKFVGRAINHEVLEKVDKLDNEVKGLKFKVMLLYNAGREYFVLVTRYFIAPDIQRTISTRYCVI